MRQVRGLPPGNRTLGTGKNQGLAEMLERPWDRLGNGMDGGRDGRRDIQRALTETTRHKRLPR